mgnify:CR=1 FL=1
MLLPTLFLLFVLVGKHLFLLSQPLGMESGSHELQYGSVAMDYGGVEEEGVT